MTMNRWELYKKIKFDLKCDLVMTYASLSLFIVSFFVGLMFIMVAGLNLLIWFNAYLITQRNKQTLEVMWEK